MGKEEHDQSEQHKDPRQSQFLNTYLVHILFQNSLNRVNFYNNFYNNEKKKEN